MDIFERRESQVRAYCRTYPTVFTHAKNARISDRSGRSYVDFFAGAGVLNFGHNNERIKQALIDYLQADGVVHSLDMYTEAKERFLEAFERTLLEPRQLPHRIQFPGPTGTNAVEAALKLARKATGRTSIVAFTDGFHGMTLGALACTGNGVHRSAAGVSLDHVHRVPFDGYLGEGVDTLLPLRRALADPSSGLTPPAAFILETIQAEGGVNVARPEWLRQVRELAREYGSLFIIDDIQVACGRTGSYFSFDGLDLDPDVVLLAKGLGGYGTPISALLIKPECDVWAPGEHTGTFRGQGLSFVAGTEALRYFENDDLCAEVRRKGSHTHEQLAKLVQKHSDRGFALRSKGMIHGLDLGDGSLASQVTQAAFERGLVIAPCGPGGRVMKVIAPLTIEEAELDEGLGILETALDATLANA